MQQPIRFGLVGYKFMGKAHSNALARLPMFFPNLRLSAARRSAAAMPPASGRRRVSWAGNHMKRTGGVSWTAMTSM